MDKKFEDSNGVRWATQEECDAAQDIIMSEQRTANNNRAKKRTQAELDNLDEQMKIFEGNVNLFLTGCEKAEPIIDKIIKEEKVSALLGKIFARSFTTTMSAVVEEVKNGTTLKDGAELTFAAYKELCAVGFTKVEAMKIIISKK